MGASIPRGSISSTRMNESCCLAIGNARNEVRLCWQAMPIRKQEVALNVGVGVGVTATRRMARLSMPERYNRVLVLHRLRP